MVQDVMNRIRVLVQVLRQIRGQVNNLQGGKLAFDLFKSFTMQFADSVEFLLEDTEAAI